MHNQSSNVLMCSENAFLVRAYQLPGAVALCRSLNKSLRWTSFPRYREESRASEEVDWLGQSLRASMWQCKALAGSDSKGHGFSQENWISCNGFGLLCLFPTNLWSWRKSAYLFLKHTPFSVYFICFYSTSRSYLALSWPGQLVMYILTSWDKGMR